MQKASIESIVDLNTIKIIGKGGFCRVYEALLLSDKTPVAIKAVSLKLVSESYSTLKLSEFYIY